MQAIRTLCAKVYPDVAPYSTSHLRGQMQHFPEGQFVAVFEGDVVGYCATFRIGEAEAFARHTWSEITGGGLASRHDADGEWLYGMEVFVDPAYRGYRIGQRLYTQRKSLCQRLGLKGIVFGGRLPALHRRMKKVGSAEAYVEAVRERRMRDPVLSFQMRNGFEPIGVLPDYLPSDRESLGYAAHLVWRNPRYGGDRPRARRTRPPQPAQGARLHRAVPATPGALVRGIRPQRGILRRCGGRLPVRFRRLPRLFTLQLLSIENQRIPASEAIATLTRYTEPLKELLSRLAVSYNINIIGGSHPTH